MTTVLWLAAAVLSWWLTGATLSAWLLPTPHPNDAGARAEFHGLALLLGVGGTAFAMFLWGLLGGHWTRGGIIATGATGAIAGVWMVLRRRQTLAGERPPRSAWARLAAVGVFALWINLLAQTLLTPQRLWDERATFAIKGAVLFEDGTIRSPELLSPRFAQGHPRYPLLLPLSEAWIANWIGDWNDRWTKVIPPLLALGTWLTFAGVLTRRCGRERAWLFTLLLAATPVLTTWEYGYLCAQADAVIASYHAVSVLYLWDALSDERRGGDSSVGWSWAIAGLLAGLALFSKDEGLALGVVDAAGCFVILAVAVVRHSTSFRRAAASVVSYLLPLLSIAVAWFAWRRGLPVTGEMTYFDRLNWDGLRSGASTLAWTVPHLLTRMFREAGTWGLMWWGVLVGIALAPRQSLQPRQVLLLWDMAGAVAALLVAGMLAPVAVQEHLGGSSHRFLMQIAPVAVLFLAGQCGPVDDSSRGAAAT
jgi:hypothetical protein